VDRRIAPSVQIEAAIEAALLNGIGGPDQLSQLGRLGAQLVLQRAVEDEVAAFHGRARYARTPDAAGSRNGHRPRRVQTAEGEIAIAVPQARDTLTRFVSSVIPDTRSIIRTGRWRRSSSARTSGACPTATSRALPARPAWVRSAGRR